jgi:hypothetical protein
MRLPNQVVPSSMPSDSTPREVSREFRDLLEAGVKLKPAGTAREDPVRLLRAYKPRYKLELYDTTYYLTSTRQNPDIRFYVAYVRLGHPQALTRNLYPRIFYKDVSLVWRSASHFVRSENENWIGKGELRVEVIDGVECDCSAEETTDLPLEIQTALEILLRGGGPVRSDNTAVERTLRRGPDDRIGAYRDFTAPRERARRDPANLVNGGRPIAHFSRPGDPASLVIRKGFEPDFQSGIVERSSSKSRLYGGKLRRYRIVSTNRKIQYLFMAGPRQVWIIPPQSTSSEITSYGVRAVDVEAPEDLSCPGYEFHYLDESEDPPEMVSQIPDGYVGKPSELDPSRCDASPWIDRLPVIRQFRREVLGRR